MTPDTAYQNPINSVLRFREKCDDFSILWIFPLSVGLAPINYSFEHGNVFTSVIFIISLLGVIQQTKSLQPEAVRALRYMRNPKHKEKFQHIIALSFWQQHKENGIPLLFLYISLFLSTFPLHDIVQ